MAKELDMRCGTLTLPQVALLAAYLLILGGLDELGIADRPVAILAIGLTVAVALVLMRRTCAPHPEGM
jgi:hypothetical protein